MSTDLVSTSAILRLCSLWILHTRPGLLRLHCLLLPSRRQESDFVGFERSITVILAVTWK